MVQRKVDTKENQLSSGHREKGEIAAARASDTTTQNIGSDAPKTMTKNRSGEEKAVNRASNPHASLAKPVVRDQKKRRGYLRGVKTCVRGGRKRASHSNLPLETKGVKEGEERVLTLLTQGRRKPEGQGSPHRRILELRGAAGGSSSQDGSKKGKKELFTGKNREWKHNTGNETGSNLTPSG